MLSEILRFYYPYGHILVALYGAFSVFICYLGVKFLFVRLKEEAEAKAMLAEMKSRRMKFQKSTLLDDLPFLMPEEERAEKTGAKESALA